MSEHQFSTYNPHPGEHILDEMEALGMSQAELARALAGHLPEDVAQPAGDSRSPYG